MIQLYFLLVAAANACPNSTAETKPLYLLTLVPFPDPQDGAGWDRGLGTIPGARVARDEINNRTDLLPGYHIELIVENIEACSRTEAGIGLNNLVKYTVNPPCRPVVAVTGLMCSSHTSALSPVAGHDGFDLIQLSAANSPIFEEQSVKFPYLWRFLGSGNLYVQATLSLMNHLKWNRIAVLYDAGSTFFKRISINLIKAIESSSDKSIVFSAGLSGTNLLLLDQIVSDIRDLEATVVFAALNPNQSNQLLCKLERVGQTFPSYIWIRITTTLHDTLQDKACEEEALTRAQQGHIELQIEGHVSNDTILVSDEDFLMYATKYRKYLPEVERDYNQSISTDLIYSSILYDQVWALALAINGSLPELKNRNLSNYGIGQRQITGVIEKHLAELDFQGASGRIMFNNKRGMQATVAIYQINGSREVLIGSFAPFINSERVVFYNLSLSIGSNDVPGDELTVVYTTLSLPGFITLYAIIGIIIVYITIVLILLIYFRKTPELKATSPYLSIGIFVGCYLVSFSTAIALIKIESHNADVIRGVLIASIVLNDIGKNLYYSILALKLIRVLRIFTTWRVKCHLLWKDAVLAIVAIIFSLSSLFTFFYLLPGQVEIQEEVVMKTTVKIKVVFVQYHNILIIIALGFVKLIVVFIVIIVAVASRKIERKNFKETKKIILLVSILFYISLTFIGVESVLTSQHEYIGANIVYVINENLQVLAVVTFLYIPKIVPVSFDKYRKLSLTSSSSMP